MSMTNSAVRRTLPVALGWLLGGVCASGGWVAHADENGFYVGLGGAVDSQRFTYRKTVYAEEDPSAFTRASGDADQALPALVAFAGYRWHLPGPLHVDAEFDVAWQGKRLDGNLEGTGYTWTDTWPEDWWLKRSASYGVTVKLGKALEDSPVGSLYALAGVRRINNDFSITETGCPGPDLLCPPTPLASFTEKVERELGAWTAGAGAERRFGERYAVQMEVHHVRYRRKSEDRLFEGGVVIPSALSGRDVGAALRLVRYF